MLISCSGTPPVNLGVVNSRLLPCPAKPNCVTSFTDDHELASEQKMTPVSYGDLITIRNQVVDKLSTMPGIKIIKIEDTYLYFTHTSTIFRFIDDGEIYFDEGEKLLHFRSASRVGHSDLGKNRQRISALINEIK